MVEDYLRFQGIKVYGQELLITDEIHVPEVEIWTTSFSYEGHIVIYTFLYGGGGGALYIGTLQ